MRLKVKQRIIIFILIVLYCLIDGSRSLSHKFIHSQQKLFQSSEDHQQIDNSQQQAIEKLKILVNQQSLLKDGLSNDPLILENQYTRFYQLMMKVQYFKNIALRQAADSENGWWFNQLSKHSQCLLLRIVSAAPINKYGDIDVRTKTITALLANREIGELLVKSYYKHIMAEFVQPFESRKVQEKGWNSLCSEQSKARITTILTRIPKDGKQCQKKVYQGIRKIIFDKQALQSLIKAFGYQIMLEVVQPFAGPIKNQVEETYIKILA